MDCVRQLKSYEVVLLETLEKYIFGLIDPFGHKEKEDLQAKIQFRKTSTGMVG
jgi:hypothetical protein